MGFGDTGQPETRDPAQNDPIGVVDLQFKNVVVTKNKSKTV